MSINTQGKSGLNSDPSTETKQDDIITELEALNSLAPATYDYVGLTYVAAGDGAGEVETVIFKTGGAGGTTISTLTLAYDASDRLSTVTKS